MAFTYGFYNSLNGDRKYDAVQMSQIFDGLIKDGVFMSVGSALMVKSSEGMNITVGIGRAWFNHTWNYNDSILPLTVEPAELILDRIDTVVLEVNSSEDARTNSIKIIKGVPSSAPVHTELIRSENVNQYPLADILVKKEITTLTQAEITNRVGTSDCPFVTGILEGMNIDNLVSKWETQWTNWMEEMVTISSNFREAQELAFNIWFDTIKGQLSEDAAGNLQNQIYSLYDKIEYIGEFECAGGEYADLQTTLNNFVNSKVGRGPRKGDLVKVNCTNLNKKEFWEYDIDSKGILSWLYFTDNRDDRLPVYVDKIIASTDWINNICSFEVDYPSSTYDLEVSLAETCTLDQLDIWNGSKIVGSSKKNELRALSEPPDVDIPVFLKVVKK